MSLGHAPEVWIDHHFERAWRSAGPKAGRLRVMPRPMRLSSLLLPPLWSLSGSVDILHCPGCILLPVAGRTRRATMIHDLGPFRLPHMKHPADTKAWQARIGLAVEKADILLANSTTTMEDILDRFPGAAGRVAVTVPGIDHLAGAPAEPRAPGSGGYILCVGTIEPRKNIDNLLRAYAALLPARPGLPDLVVAGGDGFRAGEIRRLPSELGIGDRVSFPGYVPEEGLPALYGGACCLVHPAHWEGFGFTVPEAFAHGLPVAASDRASLREFFAGAAWMIDPDEPDSIAEGIARCLDEGVAPAQREERSRLFGGLTWAGCAAATLEAFEGLGR